MIEWLNKHTTNYANEVLHPTLGMNVHDKFRTIAPFSLMALVFYRQNLLHQIPVAPVTALNYWRM